MGSIFTLGFAKVMGWRCGCWEGTLDGAGPCLYYFFYLAWRFRGMGICLCMGLDRNNRDEMRAMGRIFSFLYIYFSLIFLFSLSVY